MSQLEVTVEEYLSFLNDAEVLRRTDDQGMAEPVAETVKEDMAKATKFALNKESIQLVSREKISGYSFTRDSFTRKWTTGLAPSLCMPGVSHLAAEEYAHWLTQRNPNYRFRLPTDEEWEKAA